MGVHTGSMREMGEYVSKAMAAAKEPEQRETARSRPYDQTVWVANRVLFGKQRRG